MEIKRTPLNTIHKDLGGKMVDFAGWELPVEYAGLKAEHEMVRQKAGIFDVSHMGEVLVEGRDALEYVDYIVTNDIGASEDGQVTYTFMCNGDGGVVDDLLVYRYSREKILLVINAGNTEKDVRWIEEKSEGYQVEIRDISGGTAQIAIQGPMGEKILQRLVQDDLKDIGFFRFRDGIEIAGVDCLISRTGYTGEDGFEIYMKSDGAQGVWRELVMAGGEDIAPAGLGARDTLRFEAGLPLYGNELAEDISPVEAGFGFFVKTDKSCFIGREKLLREKTGGSTRKTVGFVLKGKGIARHGYRVFSEGKDIGVVTTGYRLPGWDESIGLALVEREYSENGKKLEIEIRNKMVEAEMRDKKFYNKNYKK